MPSSTSAMTKMQAIIVALVIIVAGVAGLAALSSQVQPASKIQQPIQAPAAPVPGPPQPVMDPRLELAKKESGLLIYGSVDAEDFAPILTAFGVKYPDLKGKIQYLRIGPREIVTRVNSETQAGKPTADMVFMSYTNAHELQRDKFFKPYKSKELSGFKPSLYDPNGEWAAGILLPAGFAYNTQLVKKEDVPRTLDEIASAKWKGKAEIHSLALGTVGTQYMATLRGIVGETKYKGFVDGLLTNVQPKPNVALHDIAQDLANGTISMGIIVFMHELTKLKEQGYPVQFFLPSDVPLLATTSTISIMKGVKSPNTAEILEDYILSVEGQTVIGNISVRFPARSGLTDVKYSVEKLAPGAELILFPSVDVAAKSKQFGDEFKKMGFG